jgi:uncharacterized membrane protein
MSDLVILAFDTQTGAGQMRNDLVKLEGEHLIGLEDAAVIVRNKEGKVKVHHEVNLVGAGALGGAFWGLLIGLIFFVPIFGLVLGTAAGAIAGKFAYGGVDEQFIKEAGNTIQPGTSALFMLVRESTPDRVMDELKKYKNVKVLKTSLSKEQEEHLREAFAGKDVKGTL